MSSKALVLKGCDFSTNKLATVTLESSTPCTGISLDQSAADITYGNTVTLTATVTPANTTDAVTWSSGDTSVVTVSNGVVTCVGVGSATVTAACGSYSATCTFTATATITGTKLYPDVYLAGNPAPSGGNGLAYFTATGTKRGAYAADSGTLSLYGNFHDVIYYPIMLPSNTGRLRITTTDSKVQWYLVMMFNSSTATSEYPAVVELLGKTAYSDVTTSNNVSIVTIPSYEGYPDVDSIVVGFQKTDSSEFVATDFDAITIEALPAE